MFGEIIKSFRVDNSLSQNMFVDMLQKSSENFHNLDAVTLSRWERGVTKPHLSRQNELLGLLGVNIFSLWGKDKEVENLEKTLKTIVNKINYNGYVNSVTNNVIKIVTINQSNSYLLSKYTDEIKLILDYEKNIIFDSLKGGFTPKAMFEKIINQYTGELVLVFFHGLLIGHLLSTSYLIKNVASNPIKLDDCHLILSFNITDISALTKTIGREMYKYLQSLNPKQKLCVFVDNRRMFDVLFNLGFEYRTELLNDESYKIMSIDKEILQSKRTWMEILSMYKRWNL